MMEWAVEIEMRREVENGKTGSLVDGDPLGLATLPAEGREPNVV